MKNNPKIYCIKFYLCLILFGIFFCEKYFLMQKKYGAIYSRTSKNTLIIFYKEYIRTVDEYLIQP